MYKSSSSDLCNNMYSGIHNKVTRLCIHMQVNSNYKASCIVDYIVDFQTNLCIQLLTSLVLQKEVNS